MVKKGALSALATIGYGLVFVVCVIVAAVLIQIGIFGIGVKDEAFSGLEISSSKTINMKIVENGEEVDAGKITLNANKKLEIKGEIFKTIDAEQKNLVLKIGSNVIVEKISNLSEFTFETSYQSLSMPICVIITNNGDDVLLYGKTESFTSEPTALLDDFKKYDPNQTLEDTDYAVLNVVTTNVAEQITLSVVGKSTLGDDSNIENSFEKINLTIKSSDQFGAKNLTGKDSPIHFLVTDEDGSPVLNEDGTNKIVDSLTVRINQPFTIVLDTYKAINPMIKDATESLYISGGTCFIHARTQNNLWKADPIKVNVDVPVESVKVKATGYSKSGDKDSDLTEIIENTNIDYTTLVNKQSFSDSDSLPAATEQPAQDKTVYLYTGEETSAFKTGHYYRCEAEGNGFSWKETDMQYFIKGDEVALSVEVFPSNALTAVSSMKKNVTFEPLTFGDDNATLENGVLKIVGEEVGTTGANTVKVSIQESYGLEANVEENITIYSAPVEVESIVANTKSINLSIGEGAKFSAEDFGIKVKSKHYTHGEDPSEKKISNLKLKYCSNHTSDINSDGIDVSLLNPSYKEVLDADANGIINLENGVWTLTPKRQLVTGEKVWLEIFFENSTYSNKQTYAKVEIRNILWSKPNNVIFNKNVDNTIHITKYGEEIEHGASPIDLINNFITTDNWENMTYKKWVFFVDKNTTNTNPVGSKIILTTENGQVCSVDNNGTKYSEIVVAQGDGSVNIVPYLVRTNAQGQPVDYFYNVITNFDTTYVINDGGCSVTDGSLAGKFVVEYKASTYTVQVVEDLTKVYFYYSDKLNEKDKLKDGEESPMGTFSNTKSLFLVGNSVMAFYNATQKGGDFDVISTGQNVEIKKGEPYIEKKEDVIASVYMAITIQKIGAERFEVSAKKGDEVIGKVSIDAKDVEVSEITAEWDVNFVDQQKEIQRDNNIKQITIYENIDENGISWFMNSKKDVPFKVPKKIKYTYNVPSGYGNTEIKPYSSYTNEYKIFALDDNQKAKLEAASSSADGTFDWQNAEEATTIKLQTISSEDTKLKFILSDNWMTETKTLYLAYITKTDLGRDDKTGEVITKYIVDYYMLNFIDKVGLTWQINNVVDQCINKDNFTNFKITGFDINAGGKNFKDANVSVVVDENMSEYFVVKNNMLGLKEGYDMGLTDTKPATTVVDNGSTINIYYYFGNNFDQQEDYSIVFEYIFKITLEGYIYKK